MTKRIFSIIISMTLILSNFGGYVAWANSDNGQAEVYEDYGSIRVVSSDKVWTVQFNRELNPKSISDESIYVMDSNGEKQTVDISIAEDSESILVKPPTGGYDKDLIYTLHISSRVADMEEKTLSSGIEMNFMIERGDIEKVIYDENVSKVEVEKVDILSKDDESEAMTIALPADTIYQYEVGDIIVQDSDEADSDIYAFKVVELPDEAGTNQYIVEIPSFYEIYDELDLSGEEELTADDIMNYGEDESITAQDVVVYDEISGQFVDAIEINLSRDKIKGSVSIGSDGIDTTASVTITRPKLRYDIKYNTPWPFNDIDTEGTISAQNIDPLSGFERLRLDISYDVIFGLNLDANESIFSEDYKEGISLKRIPIKGVFYWNTEVGVYMKSEVEGSANFNIDKGVRITSGFAKFTDKNIEPILEVNPISNSQEESPDFEIGLKCYLEAGAFLETGLESVLRLRSSEALLELKLVFEAGQANELEANLVYEVADSNDLPSKHLTLKAYLLLRGTLTSGVYLPMAPDIKLSAEIFERTFFEETRDIIKTETSLDEKDTEYTDDQYFEFDKETGTITGYSEDGPKDVVIPKEIDGVAVTNIGWAAFINSNLTNVTIPNSVTSIGWAAFSGNELTTIDIPNSVQLIHDSAFSANKLSTAHIPNSVTSIGRVAFAGNNLTSVNIPDSIVYMGNEAFSGNNLTNVTIPNSVTSIHDGTFRDNNLRSVSIPSSITSIGDSAFSDNKLESIDMPDSITSIGGWAFSNNNLTSVRIPSNAIIGNGAFYSNSLTDVEIPNSVITIGRSTFSNNNLTSVVIPNSVITISDDAFASNNLTKVEIPNSVTSIAHYAFKDNKLTNIYIPNSVYAIGNGAFANNELSSVEVPSHTSLHSSFDDRVEIIRY